MNAKSDKDPKLMVPVKKLNPLDIISAITSLKKGPPIRKAKFGDKKVEVEKTYEHIMMASIRKAMGGSSSQSLSESSSDSGDSFSPPGSPNGSKPVVVQHKIDYVKRKA